MGFFFKGSAANLPMILAMKLGICIETKDNEKKY